MAIHRFTPLLCTVALLVPPGAAPVASQDVEQLGRIYGTRPPDAYYARLRADPTAFRFGTEAPLVRSRLRTAGSTEGGGGLAAARMGTVLGPRGVAVEGHFRFPVLLALYADTPTEPFTRERIAQHFFEGPNPDGTIRDFYDALSHGRARLDGVTFPWVRTDLTAAQVAGGSSGLGSGARVGHYMEQGLARLDSTGVDWGVFDNDGPDGVPNSGDDDGIVDLLAVLHPTFGGECAAADRDTRVWSHRWRISSLLGRRFATRTPAAGGGVIQVDDYTIQPAISCDRASINEIGVVAHELGHGFGLPDLYAVGGDHAAAGQWDLMGTGSWGCPGRFRPSRPCGLGAWSRVALGWAQVVEWDPGLDHGEVVAPPVTEAGTVFRVPGADASGEYLLLENRQALGPDADLPYPGLLVWHVDGDALATRWSANVVNSDPTWMGVWLRQADGRGDLARDGGGRGDAGDVFDGGPGRDAFHAGTPSSSRSHEGAWMGVTLTDVRTRGQDLVFRLDLRLFRLVLRTEGATGGLELVAVNGEPAGQAERTVSPFETLAVEARAGESLGPGRRRGFLGWEDGSPAARTVVVGRADTTLVARYGGEEVQVSVVLDGPVPGVAPGSVEVTPGSPDGWAPADVPVDVYASARTGFAFTGWGGDLAGAANPVRLTLDGPLSARAAFDLTFAVDPPGESATVSAARPVELPFAVRDANLPVSWSVAGGTLPPGLRLDVDGVLRGGPEVAGAFAFEVRATDAIGLTTVVPFALTVTEPTFTIPTLVAPFLGDGTAPTALEARFLDRAGNGNGRYDVGDLRAWLLANPELPMTAPARQLLGAGS